MRIPPDQSSADLSRRAVLRRFALGAGGVAVLATGVTTSQSARADAKMAKSIVHYQPTPHQGQSCATCVQFVRPASCKVVQGPISPAGWCELYAKKPA